MFFYLLFWLILAFFFCSVWKELEKYTILLRREEKKLPNLFINMKINITNDMSCLRERSSVFHYFVYLRLVHIPTDFEDHHGTILNDGKPLAFDTFVLNIPKQRFNK